MNWFYHQAAVVQTLDSAIQRYYGNQLRYPLDSAIRRLNNRGQNYYQMFPLCYPPPINNAVTYLLTK